MTTTKITMISADTAEPATLCAEVSASVNKDGYAIVRDVIDPSTCAELIGYSMYRNVMGHVDRNHPLGLLGVEVEPDMVWEKMGGSE